jgi:predicted DNA-binding transcriptional regulator AlpA
LRRERVLSLRELEEKSGVSYNTIWRLEDGRQGAHPGHCGSWRRRWE